MPGEQPHCRTLSCQSGRFVRAFCSDAPFCLALLKHTWLWFMCRFWELFSVRYLINPVPLPFGGAAVHRIMTNSLTLDMETSGEPPQIAIWHLGKEPQPRQKEGNVCLEQPAAGDRAGCLSPCHNEKHVIPIACKASNSYSHMQNHS